MQKRSFKLFDKASMSLSSMIRRQSRKMRPTYAASAMGFTPAMATADVVKKSDRVSVLVEAEDVAKVQSAVHDLSPEERVEKLSESILSAHVTLDTAQDLINHAKVKRVQTKKEKAPKLSDASANIGLVVPSATRTVAETGKEVLVGIVDSGFDLSHPMFRDASGALRVVALLDQTGSSPQEFTTAQLETGWNSGAKPGADAQGHGTHVTSIAGGTAYKGLEGIAPDVRLLLVKTNFIDTADAVKWIFEKAKSKPCVVNMSLGAHWGAHDGTSAEELLIDQLSGAGKVVVIAAGNERLSRMHIGGRFVPGQSATLTFDIPRRQNRPPLGSVSLWHDPGDDFKITLITPSGQELDAPTIGQTDTYSSSSVDIEIGRLLYTPGNAIQTKVELAFRSMSVPSSLLNGWGLRIHCVAAVIGRIDGWFGNDGFGRFEPHALVEETRTIGEPACAKSCIAVASHVSKNAWKSDAGDQRDLSVLVGRTSPFSSQGPARDGRQKPDISAPGQYLTAALASGSELAGWGERAANSSRLLTIEGTSMATPVVTGIVALMFQKKRSLTPERVRDILGRSVRADAHVGTVGWNPAYGFGKIDVKAAIDAT